VSIVKFVNPPLPVRPMLNAALPTAGTPVTPGNAESWKSCVGITTKEPVEVALPKDVVTVIRPVVVFVGTVATIEVALITLRLVAEAEVTVAVTPLNLTSFLLATGSKFVPVIVTAVPGGPLLGVKLVMVGAATVVNWLAKALSGWPLVSVMAEVSESV